MNALQGLSVCTGACAVPVQPQPWLGNLSGTPALRSSPCPPGQPLRLGENAWDLKQFVIESVSLHLSMSTMNFLSTDLPAANYFLPPPDYSENDTFSHK